MGLRSERLLNLNLEAQNETRARARAILRFLESCYRADNREGALLDVFASKVDHRTFLSEPDELLSGRLPSAPIADPGGKIAEAGQVARLQRAERELLFGAFFIVGEGVCAPLVLYPAEVEAGEEDGDPPLLRIDAARGRLNSPLVEHLASLVGAEAGDADLFAERLPEHPWDLGRVGRLIELLESLAPGCVRADDLRLFPAPVDRAGILRLRRRVEAEEGALVAVFASSLLLVRKSIESRGVLSELHRLGGGEEALSAPLARFLGAAPDSALRREPRREAMPAILSAAQERVLENAAVESLSLVIGPPGTGKSFTLAAVAVDALRRGESVLIASQRDHAVDVVADKIEEILGARDFVVRGGRREHRRALRDKLDGWLRGALPRTPWSAAERRAAAAELRGLDRAAARLERRLARRGELEEHWGRLTATIEGGGVAALLARLRRAVLDARLALAPPYWRRMSAYHDTLEARCAAAARWVRDTLARRVADLPRPLLQALSKAVRARTAQGREERFDALDTGTLFRAFPVWMTRLADVGSVVPLGRELFDLAIFDEATQCDLASSLPVFQRARRVVVVGDPHQLRHLSFLSRRRQERLAEEAGVDAETAERFDYRTRSVLDVLEDVLERQDQVVFLDEHFRSAPSIIAFSNARIYDGRLRVMQERPSADAGSVELRRVEGTRDASGANPVEAAAVVEEVVRRVRGEGDHARAMCHSIGVLAPLRGQVDLLTAELGKALGREEMERHDLLVGSPFAFQGEERDVVLISLAVDDASHPAAFRFLARRDVLNVAITRARSRQIVFTSLRQAASARRGGELLADYLESLAPSIPAVAASAPPSPRGDAFLEEISAAFEERGCAVHRRYPIAGFRVDLVLERGDAAVGVDLVGGGGETAGAFEIERYRIFNRAGLAIVPIPLSAWRRDRVECVEAVLAVLAP